MHPFNALLSWGLFRRLTRPKTVKPLNEPASGLIQTEAEFRAGAEAYVAAAKERAARATLDGFVLVKAVDLKAGDTIIHNYGRFLISECGCGYFAGNEFGDYFWIKGYAVHGNPTDPKPLKDFWSFQCCPMIKCVS